MTEKKYCCKTVYRSVGIWGGTPCRGRVKFTSEGKDYCSTHYPPNVEAKNKALNEKWRLQSEKRNRQFQEIKYRASLAEKALAYMTREYPLIVEAWGAEITTNNAVASGEKQIT